MKMLKKCSEFLWKEILFAINWNGIFKVVLSDVSCKVFGCERLRFESFEKSLEISLNFLGLVSRAFDGTDPKVKVKIYSYFKVKQIGFDSRVGCIRYLLWIRLQYIFSTLTMPMPRSINFDLISTSLTALFLELLRKWTFLFTLITRTMLQYLHNTLTNQLIYSN